MMKGSCVVQHGEEALGRDCFLLSRSCHHQTSASPPALDAGMAGMEYARRATGCGRDVPRRKPAAKVGCAAAWQACVMRVDG